jgi:hypothetical protein
LQQKLLSSEVAKFAYIISSSVCLEKFLTPKEKHQLQVFLNKLIWKKYVAKRGVGGFMKLHNEDHHDFCISFWIVK